MTSLVWIEARDKIGLSKTRKSGKTGRKITTKDCARRRDSERNRRKAALSAEITQEVCLKVNCRVAAREGGRSFSINRFSELFKVLKNAGSLGKNLFDKLEKGGTAVPPFLIVGSVTLSGRWQIS